MPVLSGSVLTIPIQHVGSRDRVRHETVSDPVTAVTDLQLRRIVRPLDMQFYIIISEQNILNSPQPVKPGCGVSSVAVL